MSNQWIVWCGTNAEQDAMAKALGEECVSIYGSLSLEEKVRREALWRSGAVRVLITKPSVFGWGINWQNCSRMIFVGLSDSWEAYYQCIRRSWRFGQQKPVTVHIVLSDLEEPIYHNVMRKEREAADAQAELVRNAAEYERSEISDGRVRMEYAPGTEMQIPGWLAPAREVMCAGA